MDEDIIRIWNSRVGKNDEVYHLGDFALSNPTHALKIRERLNGVIYLIKGNHEKTALAIRDSFAWVKDVAEVNVNGTIVFMSHYAHRVWNRSHHGVYHLYGHSHGSLPDDPNSLSLDVGFAVHRKPLDLVDIKMLMSNKTFKPIDHHGHA